MQSLQMPLNVNVTKLAWADPDIVSAAIKNNAGIVFSMFRLLFGLSTGTIA